MVSLRSGSGAAAATVFGAGAASDSFLVSGTTGVVSVAIRCQVSLYSKIKEYGMLSVVLGGKEPPRILMHPERRS